jgi:accessory gene regulator protein AgrB
MITHLPVHIQPLQNHHKNAHGSIIIQFNSIYLHANLTVQSPITKTARVEKKKKYKQNTKAIIIIIIIIIITAIIVHYIK